jgi:UDP-glucuronate 4-epimerase
VASILLTGGAGFIGSHLAERLLSRGDRVVAFDSLDPFYDPGIKRANIASLLKSSGFSMVEGDIRDVEKLESLFTAQKFDAVIHLAARAGVRPSIEEPVLYADVNLNGTSILLESCKKFQVKKFVFGSSSSVYGNANKVPFSESDPVANPVSPYAATKAAGELLCHAYHHIHGLDITCLRFFTVYGPRQRPEMAIHKFARWILDGEMLTRYGDGSSERDYTYVDDIIDGVERALDRLGGFKIYNLGESRRISLSALIEMLESEIGIKAKLKEMPDQPGDVRTTWANIQKAKTELGYDPQVPIEEGISRFVKWLREQRASGHSSESGR